MKTMVARAQRACADNAELQDHFKKAGPKRKEEIAEIYKNCKWDKDSWIYCVFELVEFSLARFMWAFRPPEILFI